ncbi:Rv3654c family TadE-like protein [Streptomyces sp. NBC_00690]|uniref:Rv3654c family TadE-like protein n=1 Tax=Streptomyces sp. NBC_00690 TaxID=2975808 RepID=UPI002E27FCB8|nr:Rv3654c family TadE-like protein [Streptomyces sp. NBC_00690]
MTVGHGLPVARARIPATDDRGSATVWTAMAVTTLCLVFAAVLALGQAVVTRHRASTAADLASLAAASHALLGPAPACAKGVMVARAQGAEVVRCAVRGEVAEVTTRVAFGPYTPEARARAGPPEAMELPVALSGTRGIEGGSTRY